jgi:hypothetical protein
LVGPILGGTNVDFRCDLDICIILKKDTIRVSFEELVLAMRRMFLNVYPAVINEGRKNAQYSKKFLVKHHAKPIHVLHSLERSIQMETEQDRLNMAEQIANLEPPASTVKGRFSDMELLEDGTLVPTSTMIETQKIDGFRRREEGTNAIPFVSRVRFSPDEVFQELEPLSDWNLEELGIPTLTEVSTSSDADGFEWLLGNQETVNELSTLEKTKAQTVKLDWPLPDPDAITRNKMDIAIDEEENGSELEEEDDPDDDKPPPDW